MIILLDVQVDEFTLVLQSTKRPSQIEGWDGLAINIINEFVRLSKLEIVLGKLKETTYSLP